MKKSITLPAQYYRLYLHSKPYGCDESDFSAIKQTLELPIDQTAMVLVDTWNMHYVRSWEQRAGKIMERFIAPALKAARKAGITIIHAPTPTIAAKHEVSAFYKVPGEQPAGAAYAQPDPEWPPREFVERKGPYSKYDRDAYVPQKFWIKKYEKQDIADSVKPVKGDYIISTGPQLHRLAKDKQILHLIYAGFAANMCLQYRDYGIRAFNRRGYNTIVLRDCTTALESHDTVKKFWTTQVMIREMEHQYGFSSTSAELVKACKQVKN